MPKDDLVLLAIIGSKEIELGKDRIANHCACTTPLALLLLSSTEMEVALQIGTSLIGISLGFIFSAAVSVTSELFGPKSVGVNHNILMMNISVGSLVYGLLSTLVYDSTEASFRNV